MERAKEEDNFDFDKIVVVYAASNGLTSSFYAFRHGDIINLDELLQGENRRRDFRGKIGIGDHLIRTLFDHNFERIGSLNDNTPYITDNCKYILVRNVADVDITDYNWSRMIYKDYLEYVD
ncbi:hypothetical protein GGI09_002541 [Coemansia sp. S100]|nr:hypothetical protein GGI16_006744 [Coemansia sp. S142-1]KAJ2099903.1 hypothetical protein GGI09_002541 [Coemansia sp. S100]